MAIILAIISQFHLFLPRTIVQSPAWCRNSWKKPPGKPFESPRSWPRRGSSRVRVVPWREKCGRIIFAPREWLDFDLSKRFKRWGFHNIYIYIPQLLIGRWCRYIRYLVLSFCRWPEDGRNSQDGNRWILYQHHPTSLERNHLHHIMIAQVFSWINISGKIGKRMRKHGDKWIT